MDIVPVRSPALFSRDKAWRTEYLRAKSTPEGLEAYPQQSSGVLLSSVWGDGLAIHQEGQEIHMSQEIDFLPYSLLL